MIRQKYDESIDLVITRLARISKNYSGAHLSGAKDRRLFLLRVYLKQCQYAGVSSGRRGFGPEGWEHTYAGPRRE